MNGPQVKTLLQNITVLSAGQNYQKDAEGKPAVVQVVNLLVTPEQAEVLALASNPNDQTHIQLVLRNPLDTQLAKVPGSGMANLFASDNGPTPALSFARMKHSLAPRGDVVEVFIGSQRTLQRIGYPEGK